MSPVPRTSPTQLRPTSRVGRSRHRARHLTPRRLASALAACSLLTLSLRPSGELHAQTLPTGLNVVQGQVTVGTVGAAMTVTNSPNSILNWNSFSIGAQNSVRFDQQSATSQVLNRVVGNDPSAILGSLSSNGKVWLLNQNGVLFGRGARVDVAGLVTSTLNLNDTDWLAGRYSFTSLAGSAGANVLNQGELRTSLGGRIALLGGNVSNEGLIDTAGGQVVLAAGKSIELVDTGSPNLSVRVTAPLGETLNLGTLSAAGGRIDLHAATVNQSGIVRANSISQGAAGEVVMRATTALNLTAGSSTEAAGAQGGKLSLDAGDAGRLLISGNVSANGTEGSGGQIELLGRQVGLIDQAHVDASGRSGGGQVLVGGGQEGKDASVRNAEAVYLGPTASISADATGAGNGGRIILWSDHATRAYGSLSARGGALGGNGGFIETSGGWLDARPALIDVEAPHGRSGTWLIDPYNLVISDTLFIFNVNSDPTESVFTAAGPIAQLRTSNIVSALNKGTNVVISTGGAAGDEVGNITLNSASA